MKESRIFTSFVSYFGFYLVGYWATLPIAANAVEYEGGVLVRIPSNGGGVTAAAAHGGRHEITAFGEKGTLMKSDDRDLGRGGVKATYGGFPGHFSSSVEMQQSGGGGGGGGGVAASGVPSAVKAGGTVSSGGSGGVKVPAGGTGVVGFNFSGLPGLPSATGQVNFGGGGGTPVGLPILFSF